MRKLWLPSAIACLALTACDQSTGPGTAHLSGKASLNATSGCYAVRFTWTASPSGPTTFSGSLAGDLEGTMTSDFDPGSLKFAGTTLSVSFTNHWSVTGGILPAPSAFVTVSEGLNHITDRAGSSATTFESTSIHHALSGVAKANLNSSAVVDFAVIPPTLVANFNGVICP